MRKKICLISLSVILFVSGAVVLVSSDFDFKSTIAGLSLLFAGSAVLVGSAAKYGGSGALEMTEDEEGLPFHVIHSMSDWW